MISSIIKINTPTSKPHWFPNWIGMNFSQAGLHSGIIGNKDLDVWKTEHFHFDITKYWCIQTSKSKTA